MNIPKDVALALLITNPVFKPWLKPATAKALADAFGCLNTSVVPNVEVDPTVAEVLACSDKEIMAKPHLDKSAVAQVHALRTAVMTGV